MQGGEHEETKSQLHSLILHTVPGSFAAHSASVVHGLVVLSQPEQTGSSLGGVHFAPASHSSSAAHVAKTPLALDDAWLVEATAMGDADDATEDDPPEPALGESSLHPTIANASESAASAAAITIGA